MSCIKKEIRVSVIIMCVRHMKVQQSTSITNLDKVAWPSQKGGAGVLSSLVLKRFLDIALVLLSLPVIVPLMAMIALAIKLDSRGSILYTQYRHGQFDKQFLLYKFRSMHMKDCTPHGGKQVSAKDKRCTRVGRFLRRTSLDELPQFFNILKGDMSLVGPRPHAVDHNIYYGDKIAQYWRRHHFPPGLTGLAQIKGCRGETKTIDAMADRVKHDLDYIDGHSLWLDIKIILLTFRELLFPKNAY